MSEKLYLYPKGIRLWHTLNALLILILIFTGIAIQYVGYYNANIISFKNAISYHNIAGVLLTISYIFFFIAGWQSKNFRFYHFRGKQLIKHSLVQAKYYAFGVFKKEPHPYDVTEKEKFNPLQKISYLYVMFLFVPLVILTGWGLLFPELTLPGLLGPRSIHVTDLIHIFSGFILSVFLIIHIYFSTMGTKWYSNFKSIITGYHYH